MTADNRTIAFYDAEAKAYAAGKHKPLLLDAFMDEVVAGGRVLDLGCGAGVDSAALRDAGFAVTAVDASKGLATEARRLWDIDVRMLAFTDLDYADAFDGVWASASLHHAPTEELPAIFAAIRRAIKVGGCFYATLKAGEDRRDRFGRFYCAMSASALASLAADWRSVRIEEDEGVGYDGETTPWLKLCATR